MLKEEERRQRETAVYQAVLRLIGNGADITKLRVQEIAAEAGIGKGTVYEYFSSKEEILRGVTAGKRYGPYCATATRTYRMMVVE